MKIGLLYLGLHNLLVRKYGVNTIIKRKEFQGEIGKHYILPKELRPIMLREMVKKELIERIDRDNIKILDIGIDIEDQEDRKRLNSLIGI